jgi:hypothetical protein
LPAPKGRGSKNNPTPVMAEFSHELLTGHQDEAARAFVPLVSLLETVVADAVAAGEVRSGFEHDDAAGLILSTIMFNATYGSTISGTKPHDSARAADAMWQFVSTGMLAPSNT